VKLYDDADRALTVLSWGLVVFAVCYFGLHALFTLI